MIQNMSFLNKRSVNGQDPFLVELGNSFTNLNLKSPVNEKNDTTKTKEDIKQTLKGSGNEEDSFVLEMSNSLNNLNLEISTSEKKMEDTKT